MITDPSAERGPNEWRIPASEIESAVIRAILSKLMNEGHLLNLIELARPTPASIKQVFNAAKQLTARLKDLASRDVRKQVRDIVTRVVVEEAAVKITLNLNALADALAIARATRHPEAASDHEFAVPIRMSRRGVEQKIIITSGIQQPVMRDETLIRAIARAHCWFEELKTGAVCDITEIAKRETLPSSYVQLMMLMAFLAPDIVAAILEGRQPADLTLDRLMKRTNLAGDWNAQRAQLGFAP